jgi:GrpB-like predicted nucleotidyltransferase (UPF0157 family)
MTKNVVVEPYNPKWAHWFAEIKESIWPAIEDFALSIEHVGSTSVPGLAAKPIIDIDIIIPNMSSLNQAIAKLGELGYVHRGNLGIQDREAFKKKEPIHRHNLYVCPQNSISLQNHLCLRNSLREDPSLRDEYAAIKYKLAEKFPDSIDDYIEGKTEFILNILRSHGYGPDNLEAIRIANLAPSKK